MILKLKKLPWKACSSMPPINKQISPEEQKRPEFQRELAFMVNMVLMKL